LDPLFTWSNVMTDNPKHICCVRLTHWPIDRLQRQQRRRGSRREERHEGTEAQRHGVNAGLSASPCLSSRNTFLLTRTTANRQIVVAMSDDAEAIGIKVGMTLPEARSLCATVRAIEHEPHRDAVALEALARWMLRFTPVVCVGDGRDSESVSPSPLFSGERGPELHTRINRFCQGERLIFEGVAAHPRDQLRVRAMSGAAQSPQHSALFLDLTGSQYIFGSYANIVQQIDSAMHRFGLRSSIATGPTVGAAWALTFSSRHGRETHAPLQTALNALPPIALRIDDDTAAALHHLGVTTIGLLRKLPRKELLTRFGPLLLKRLNQALGLDDEVLIPIRPIEPIECGVEFEFGVDSLELLWSTIQEQVHAIVAQLARRGMGARTIEFTLLLQDEAPLSQTLNLSRPSRDPKRLFRLIRVATESFTASSLEREARKKITARRLFGARFNGVRLRVLDAMRIRDDQIALLEGENVVIEDAITDLVERLGLRLPGRVTQARLVESHLPERAWKPERALTSPTPGQLPGSDVSKKTNPNEFGYTSRRKQDVTAPQPGRQSDRLEFNPKLIAPPNTPCPGEPPMNPRPLQLTAPQEIHVMVSPSHDRDGRPIAYTTREGVHRRILHARGPERIAGEWWRGHVKTRDYFDIEDDAHHRLWMFRVNDNGRWFVQGHF